MDYINLLTDRGLGNFMDSRTDEELLKADRYVRMMEEAGTIKERLYETELSEIQKNIVDDYVAALYDASERASRISYMTCLKYAVRFLLEMQNE